MDAQQMKDNLTKNSEELRDRLVELETEFNQKKEQFLKVQGALEALNELESPSNPTE